MAKRGYGAFRLTFSRGWIPLFVAYHPTFPGAAYEARVRLHHSHPGVMATIEGMN